MSAFRKGEVHVQPFFEFRKKGKSKGDITPTGEGWYADAHYDWRFSKAVPVLADGSSFDAQYPKGTEERTQIIDFTNQFGVALAEDLKAKAGLLSFKGKNDYKAHLAEAFARGSERITNSGHKHSASYHSKHTRPYAVQWGRYTGLQVDPARDDLAKVLDKKADPEWWRPGHYQEYGIDE